MKKIISYLICDGNVTRVGVGLAVIIGLLIMAASLCFSRNQNVRILGASIGLAFVSFGGYSARAGTLGFKPIDNSYKKAKATYNKSESEEEDKVRSKNMPENVGTKK